ncbi:microfibril-associated glycoprotein 4 [Leptinotarsa decemlineata]|uniref:microfibril-associated glycoprotein 4 n=1 Tax=Leptinotarsa decemlineata TaxID=7539 RepID=UPI003D30B6CA
MKVFLFLIIALVFQVNGNDICINYSSIAKMCGRTPILSELEELLCPKFCARNGKDSFREELEPNETERLENRLSCASPSLACQNGPLCEILVGIDKPKICQLPCDYEQSKKIPKNCQEILKEDSLESGMYLIKPNEASEPFRVLCDLKLNGGGWTYIQRRFDGSQDFDLGWRDYKFGFGTLLGEFWIGLENIHALTGSETNELVIEITGKDGKNVYANYKTFKIDGEDNGYRLSELKHFIGSAGDSLSFHLGSKFSTKDIFFPEGNYNWPKSCKGGWWYNDGFHSSLNGAFLNNTFIPEKHEGLYWKTFEDNQYVYPKTRMMVRPANDFWYEQRKLRLGDITNSFEH